MESWTGLCERPREWPFYLCSEKSNFAKRNIVMKQQKITVGHFFLSLKFIIVYILQPFFFSVKFVSNFRYSFPISWTATVKKSIPLKKFLIFFSMWEGTVNPYFGCKACTLKTIDFAQGSIFVAHVFPFCVLIATVSRTTISFYRQNQFAYN